LNATRTCAGARNELELGGSGEFMADYIIIGGDQKEYGPISADEVRQWVTQGRAAAHTKVKMEGATEWKTLADFPEFHDVLKSPVPPTLATSESAGTSKLSGMAVTSLVLGILGMFSCGLTAIFGLILGIIAVTKVKNSRGALTGFGIALAGLIVSAVALMMIPIFAAMLLPALASAHEKAREINCVNNEKQLALAIRIYSGDNKDKFPPAATWCDAIQPETNGNKQLFRCPAVNSPSRCDYAFNTKLDGLDESKVSPQTVMIFESDAGWNASGSSELMISKPRHARRFVVAFADGSVQQLKESELNTLRWDP
jgi:prepilin-type processing-associated H-X9-DG protein